MPNVVTKPGAFVLISARAREVRFRPRTPRWGVRSVVMLARRRLFARVTDCLHVPDLLHDLIQIVACRILQWREVDVRFELLQP